MLNLNSINQQEWYSFCGRPL